MQSMVTSLTQYGMALKKTTNLAMAQSASTCKYFYASPRAEHLAPPQRVFAHLQIGGRIENPILFLPSTLPEASGSFGTSIARERSFINLRALLNLTPTILVRPFLHGFVSAVGATLSKSWAVRLRR